jgi:four helix bundle protein
VIVLVLVVVLVLEWAGKLGAERSCQLIATPLDLCMVSPANVDREKLDVYQLELKFLTWVSQFLADLSGPLSAQTRELREQLDRASLSALLNTAEGNGRRQGRQRAKFFDDARGSAIEWAACLDASVAKGFASSERTQSGKEMLVRIVAMLTKLVERFDPYQYPLHRRHSDG